MTDPAHTREWVRAVTRSGLLDNAELRAEVSRVIAADHPSLNAETTAAEWVAAERDHWTADAAEWPQVTDHDRLCTSLDELGAGGFVVLRGCNDHWAARDALAQASAPRGAVWFTAADVWHAVDEPMLELNLWHPDTANAAPGDVLLDEVLEVLASHGVIGHFDEGRIELPLLWQARP